jgi:zinc/manganese transport system permease protein
VTFSWNIVTDLRAMWQWAFMRNAIEAGGIAAVMAGMVGYLVVLRRSAFATHALGHGGFSGAAGAVLFGVNPIYGLLLATSAGGVGMALAGKRATTRDVEIGTILAFMLAIGLVFLSLYKGYASEAYTILFGEILGISAAEVLLMLEVSVGVVVALALVWRPLLFSSLDPDVAEAKGLPMTALGLVFMLLVAVAISFSVTVVGVLLIFALMVTPAAAAVRLTQRPLYAVTASVLIALSSTWLGLTLAWFASAYWPYPVSAFPASFFIVTIAFGVYVAVRVGLWIAHAWVHPLGSRSPEVEATSDGT